MRIQHTLSVCVALVVTASGCILTSGEKGPVTTSVSEPATSTTVSVTTTLTSTPSSTTVPPALDATEWLDDVFDVAVAPDGSIWVATDALYNDPSTVSPDTAAGVARYDGTGWTTYTIEDGLLSNDAVIATGPDGTVWAIHSEIPPYGYARFDDNAWTPYPTDQPVGGFRGAVDANGTLWTTANGELVSFNGSTTTAYASPFTRP